MRECVCNECGMEFTVDKFDTTKEQLKDGHPIEVVSFTCPKCDERYIVAVRDEESAHLRNSMQKAQEKYSKSYDPEDPDKMRKAKNEVRYRKSALMSYMNKLKKRYLKELRRRGQ